MSTQAQSATQLLSRLFTALHQSTLLDHSTVELHTQPTSLLADQSRATLILTILESELLQASSRAEEADLTRETTEITREEMTRISRTT